MDTSTLISACNAQVEQFARQIDALSLANIQDKKHSAWILSTNLSEIEIVYRRTGGSFQGPSQLYALIYPFKNGDFSVLLHELQDLCGICASGTSIYCFLHQPEQMTVCAKALLEQIAHILPVLNSWSADESLYRAAREQKLREILRVFRLKPSQLPKEDSEAADPYYRMLFSSYQSCLLTRFTSPQAPYQMLAQGKQKKALKTYEKWESRGILSCREQAILQQLRQGRPLSPPEWAVSRAIIPYMDPHTEGVRLFMGMVLLWLLLAPVFCGIVLLMQVIFSAETLFYFGLPWYWGCLFAALPAMFGGIAFQRELIPILNRKNRNAALAADKMTNGNKIYVITKILFGILLTACLLLSVATSTIHLRFNSDALTFPATDSIIADLLTTEYTTQSYTDIVGIYKIEGRYNFQDEYIPRPSYVLLFADGSRLDLDGFVSVEDTEKSILPLLKPHVETYTVLASDRALPQ